jgi:hypothetical protein
MNMIARCHNPWYHNTNFRRRESSYHTVYDIYEDCLLGYRSGGPGSIPGTTKKKVVGLERGPLSLASSTEELLDRKVAAPV